MKEGSLIDQAALPNSEIDRIREWQQNALRRSQNPINISVHDLNIPSIAGDSKYWSEQAERLDRETREMERINHFIEQGDSSSHEYYDKKITEADYWNERAGDVRGETTFLSPLSKKEIRTVLGRYKKELTGQNSRILDIGGGHASGIYFSGPMLSHVTNMDISSRMLKKSWAEGQVVADANQSLPFADEVFSAATLFASSRYISNVPEAIHEIKRVLRPGGRLLIIDYIFTALRQRGAVSVFNPYKLKLDHSLEAFDTIEIEELYKGSFRGEDNPYLHRPPIYLITALKREGARQ